MKGIITKPTQCCNNSSTIGKIVTVIGKTPIGQRIHRTMCKSNFFNNGEFVRIGVKSGTNKYFSVNEYRIKFFDDDLDKEIKQEYDLEINKQLEIENV